MIDIYVELSSNLRLIAIKDNMVILYDEFKYDSAVLDKAYNLLSFIKPDRVTVITCAVYDKAILKDSYNLEQLFVGDCIYNGLVSQVDINTLMHLLNSLKIKEIRVVDKFKMYEHFLQDNSCIVDYTNKSYLILVKTSELASITYAKRAYLEQALLQQCRKFNILNITNLTTYIDYDCVARFSNFSRVGSMTVYNLLTTCGFFHFIYTGEFKSPDDFKFDRNLKSYKQVDTEKIYKKESVEDTSVDTIELRDKSTENSDTTEVPVIQKKSATEVPVIQKKHVTKLQIVTMLLYSITLIMLILSILTTNKVATLNTESNINSMKASRYSTKLELLKEEPLREYNTYIDKISKCVIGNSVLASITCDTKIDAVFYLAESDSLEVLKSNLSNEFGINGISEGSTVTIGDTVYSKITVSLSCK